MGALAERPSIVVHDIGAHHLRSAIRNTFHRLGGCTTGLLVSGWKLTLHWSRP